MLKFQGRTRDGRRLIGLGMTKENVEALKDDKPLYVDTARDYAAGGFNIPMGPVIAIVVGDSLEELQEKFEEHGWTPKMPPDFKWGRG